MSIRSLRRLAPAAVLAVGLLIGAALPAGASATHIEIQPSSTIRFHPSTGGPAVANMHFPGHVVTSQCPPVNSQPPAHIPVGLDSTSGGPVGPGSTGWVEFPTAAGLFKARLNILGGGTALSTTGTNITLNVTVTVATCPSLATICTTNPFTINLNGPSVGHHPTVSTTVTVAGMSTHITTPPTCPPFFQTLFNSRHAVANLNLHFTDSSI